MEMRLVTIVIVTLLLQGAVKADIYQCMLSGTVVFSDKPCAEDAEKLNLSVYRPSQQAVDQQQQTTQQFEQKAMLHELQQLRDDRNKIRENLAQIQRDRKKALKVYTSQLYSIGDEKLATREQDLFQKMNVVAQEYDAKTRQAQKQLKQVDYQIAKIEANMRH